MPRARLSLPPLSPSSTGINFLKEILKIKCSKDCVRFPEPVFERFAEIQTLYFYGYMKFPERCNNNTLVSPIPVYRKVLDRTNAKLASLCVWVQAGMSRRFGAITHKRHCFLSDSLPTPSSHIQVDTLYFSMLETKV